MFRAVVFDMDGVILDSEKIYRKNEYVAAEHFGLDLSRVEYFCNLIAGGRYEKNKEHFRNVFGTDVSYDEFRAVISKGVEEHAVDPGYDLKDGVWETLCFLKERGIKIALATSTDEDRMNRFLDSASRKAKGDVKSFFDVIVCGDKVKKAKPEPDIYLTACEGLGVLPEETIGVEDSINGVLSSAAAGLFTVMVVDLIKPNDIVREKADRIFDHMRELKNLIEPSE